VSTALARFGSGLARLLGGADRLEVTVGPGGPTGDFQMPSAHDGTWETVTVAGRSCRLTSIGISSPATASTLRTLST